ncbi:hypothetical protein Bca4012_019242 [Brassica carinata]
MGWLREEPDVSHGFSDFMPLEKLDEPYLMNDKFYVGVEFELISVLESSGRSCCRRFVPVLPVFLCLDGDRHWFLIPVRFLVIEMFFKLVADAFLERAFVTPNLSRLCSIVVMITSPVKIVSS